MNSQLTIELNQFGVKYSIFEKSEVVSSNSTSFSLTEDAKSQCETFFIEEKIVEKSYDEVTLSWYNHQSTMIPMAIFGESNPKEIFNLSYPKIAPDFEIDYNRMPMEGVVNIYSIPSWVKRFFIIKFPRIIIQHCTSHVVRAGLSQDAFKPKFILSLYKETFHLVLIRHNELQFFSSFDSENIEDIIYYLSYVTEQKELSYEKGKIILTGNQEEKAKETIKVLERIDLFSSYALILYTDFIAKAQLQCV